MNLLRIFQNLAHCGKILGKKFVKSQSNYLEIFAGRFRGGFLRITLRIFFYESPEILEKIYNRILEDS